MKQRGFEIVSPGYRKNMGMSITLPSRADNGSAGYDFYVPVNVAIPPKSSALLWTDVKAYMLEDEVLEIYMRSSVATKQGVILKNIVAIIDSSYYGNESTDGNIGLCLENTTSNWVTFEEGERVCQGIFKKYLTIDSDTPRLATRVGGFGSSDR